uniref:Putative sodium/metabolite cotransporter BASS1ic n=1 Tax=Rhizophora mucronata TaxID=61149 RepID=A0A2P2IM91_RHIMU
MAECVIHCSKPLPSLRDCWRDCCLPETIRFCLVCEERARFL